MKDGFMVNVGLGEGLPNCFLNFLVVVWMTTPHGSSIITLWFPLAEIRLCDDFVVYTLMIRNSCSSSKSRVFLRTGMRN